jgi:hypothetical protein
VSVVYHVLHPCDPRVLDRAQFFIDGVNLAAVKSKVRFSFLHCSHTWAEVGKAIGRVCPRTSLKWYTAQIDLRRSDVRTFTEAGLSESMSIGVIGTMLFISNIMG